MKKILHYSPLVLVSLLCWLSPLYASNQVLVIEKGGVKKVIHCEEIVHCDGIEFFQETFFQCLKLYRFYTILINIS